jgi:hypothetical protein
MPMRCNLKPMIAKIDSAPTSISRRLRDTDKEAASA